MQGCRITEEMVLGNYSSSSDELLLIKQGYKFESIKVVICDSTNYSYYLETNTGMWQLKDKSVVLMPNLESKDSTRTILKVSGAKLTRQNDYNVFYKKFRSEKLITTYAKVIKQESVTNFPLVGGPSVASTIFRFYTPKNDSLTFGIPYSEVVKNGDVYLMTYDPIDANGVDKQLIHLTKPVFLNDEKTVSTSGTIVDLSINPDDSTLNYVQFSYDVINPDDSLKRETYNRTQFVRSKELPMLKLSKKYKVKYLLSNPFNAVIYLDKAIP